VPGGGVSGSQTFLVINPAPVLVGLSPVTVVAGSPGFTLTATGSNLSPTSVVRWDGSPLATTYVNPTELQAAVTSNLILAGGQHAITVSTPNPGGGMSSSVLLNVLNPALSAILPPLTPPFSGTGALPLSVSGTNFLTGSVLYADGLALATSYVSSTILMATVPDTLVQAGWDGGIAINVANTSLAVSNTMALQVGGGANAATIRTQPLDPAPGTAYAVKLEGGYAGAPFTLFVDFGTPTPVAHWPTAAADLVVGVGLWAGSSGPLIPLLDGLGFSGAPGPFALGAGGSFDLGGLVQPNPPLGVTLALQAVYIDPGSPIGLNMTWTRNPFGL
jgi:hypothetical protein